MEQAKKYGPIIGGVIITALVLWYLFKDSVETVTSATTVNTNASSYSLKEDKAAIKAEYNTQIAAATSESEKAKLKAELEAELEAAEERDLLFVEYYERFKSYPKTSQSNASIQAEIDSYDRRAYNVAVEEYLQYTTANPPSDCTTAEKVYAALDKYKANEKAEANKKKAVDAEQKKKDEWSARKKELNDYVNRLNSRFLFKNCKLQTQSDEVWEITQQCLDLPDRRDIVYLTTECRATCQWEEDSKFGKRGAMMNGLLYKHVEDSQRGPGWLSTRNKMYLYWNDRIPWNVGFNPDVAALVKRLYNEMTAAWDYQGQNGDAGNHLVVNDLGEVTWKGKVITY